MNRRHAHVYVVDDDPVVANAIAELMQIQGYQAAVYHDAESFLDDYRPGHAACVVLDVHMPGKSGLDALEFLSSKVDMPPVVMVTGHADVPMCVQAMRQGAFHFLEKPYVPAELVAVVGSAVQKSWDRLARRGIPVDLEERLGTLDAEEQQILELVLEGKVNKQIAHQLHMGERTVQFRVSSLLGKLGVSTRRHLAQILKNHRIAPVRNAVEISQMSR